MARFLVLIASILTLSHAFAFTSEDTLLPADQAFKFDAEIDPSGQIIATWEVADGYYMYRDKLDFEFIGDDISASPGELPQGEMKQDALFGEVEVYTQTFAIPISTSADQSTSFTLIAKGQGCNEPVGICYPPMSQQVTFTRPNLQQAFSLASNTIPDSEPVQSLTENTLDQDISGLNSASDLRSLLSSGFDQQDFLDVDDAFRLQIEPGSSQQLQAVFQITQGYYLYKDKINFSNEGTPALGDILFPKGKIKQDEYFGEVEVYETDLVIPINYSGNANDLIINATYQGCAVDGICYSPVNKTFTLAKLNSITQSDSTSSRSDSIFSSETGFQQAQSGVTALGSPLKSSTGILFGALIAGLLLTFTPCVLPMIPILSSIIAGQGNKLTRARGGLLATVYVAGTVVTYTFMGVIAGATGDQLQAYFQNIWAIGILSALFFVMALSMFGLFELQMPGFIQSKIQSRTGNLGGTIPMVFILGLFSALIIGACVSPVLISFLGIAVSSQDPRLGAQIMAIMALGMGLPLILLGFGAGHFIPRAGQWMDKIKQGFGIMLIAVAIYLLGLLPSVPVMLLWGSFFIILSVFLRLGQKSGDALTQWDRLEKGFGIILLVWGVLVLAGGLMGQRSLLQPLPLGQIASVLQGGPFNTANQTHQFTAVENTSELEYFLEMARAEQKNVLIDYYADWCVDCIRMEESTFSSQEVKSYLDQHFVSLKIDVTDPNDHNGKELKKRYGVFGPPATLLIDRSGQLLTELNFYGYKDETEFLSIIRTL